MIGGGDWAEDRIVPDCVRALQRAAPVLVRNENAIRPWQHVLEPLSGYLLLGEKLWEEISGERLDRKNFSKLASPFNFGPMPTSERTVGEVVTEVLRHWPGRWISKAERDAPHEAERLSLAIDKAANLLDWRPVWDFKRAVAETIVWYQTAASKKEADLSKLTQNQISNYSREAAISPARRIEK